MKTFPIYPKSYSPVFLLSINITMPYVSASLSSHYTLRCLFESVFFTCLGSLRTSALDTFEFLSATKNVFLAYIVVIKITTLNYLYIIQTGLEFCFQALGKQPDFRGQHLIPI